ncbi:hypothetical protein Q4519_18665 [Motilimonas sp. 1_MG-2023]|uniref:hypothetical protein n=1 Tax=Motilimonas sp. 1_MG-2023 TaxID=3062672 RepID=UPI0026E292AE|nr:hypothetical protein [Motilimonas sp. 1_MG-2023]MDO6527702.1 hypothetical protein [Motilimonas sp. 1_MG-2023]
MSISPRYFASLLIAISSVTLPVNAASYQVKLWLPWQEKDQPLAALKLTDGAASLSLVLLIDQPKPVDKPTGYPNYQVR